MTDRIMTPEERRIARCAASAKWRAKPGNAEKHRASVKRCRGRPVAKEKHRVRQLIYAAGNREQERLRVERWRKENPDKAIESRRVYYLKNTEKIKAKSRNRYRENIEAYREYSRQYKHSKRAGGGRLSRGYIKRLMEEQQGLCRACRCDLKESGHHLDHIKAISKGGLHCNANVQLLCPPCNRRKSAKNFEDFLVELMKDKAA